MGDPKSLPIYRYEDAIVEAIREHRVLVLEGPTGSGKTTQLPQILSRAFDNDLTIGVTQPRRIAAVSVAWRVAEEMDVTLGEEVGYSIRFDDKSGPDTRIKIMTDGILLQEARTDPAFSRYGVIIVDEAHERTLNIDLTLGLLHHALKLREDLRVVVSSATLQPLVFQRYFESAVGEVPVVNVDARPYPVDLWYRPARNQDEDGLIDATIDAISDICRHEAPGHVLAFLPGEGSIRQVCEALVRGRLPREVMLLPLYGRLTREEQESVFLEPPDSSPSGRPWRKVVVSTNIAETSITVPGIRYVVDSGVAKVPRYDRRSGLFTLSLEPISKASCDQRLGRAGRTQPGRCIRLYSQKSYQRRPDFTEEEILRLNLSDVVLRLIDLGIRDIENFPLPTRPPAAALRDAIALLVALGAILPDRSLTPIGSKMIAFPLSPPLARMVLEAAELSPNVLDETLILAAYLSSRSPFLFPRGEEQHARLAQRPLEHPTGDAMTAIQAVQGSLRAADPKKYATDHYLDPDIMAFIRKAHSQLADIAVGLGYTVGSGGSPEPILKAVAAGHPRQILRRKGRAYRDAHDNLISIHPSSALFHSRPRFAVATDIVVSSRPYARNVSAIDAAWIARLYPELARQWQIKVRAPKAAELRAEVAATLPEFILLGGVKVPVEKTRKRVTVVLPLAQAAALKKLNLETLELPWLRLRAELRGDDLRVGRSQSLGRWLALLPTMNLPKPDQADKKLKPPRDAAVGTLFELEREPHALARILPHCLQPFTLRNKTRAAWLALVSNGAGGFWTELVPDWEDALRTTEESGRDLLQSLPAGEESAALETALNAWEDRRREADAAVGEWQALQRKGRRRR